MTSDRKLRRTAHAFTYEGDATRQMVEQMGHAPAPTNRREKRAHAAKLRKLLWKQEQGKTKPKPEEERTPTPKLQVPKPIRSSADLFMRLLDPAKFDPKPEGDFIELARQDLFGVLVDTLMPHLKRIKSPKLYSELGSICTDRMRKWMDDNGLEHRGEVVQIKERTDGAIMLTCKNVDGISMDVAPFESTLWERAGRRPPWATQT